MSHENLDFCFFVPRPRSSSGSPLCQLPPIPRLTWARLLLPRGWGLSSRVLNTVTPIPIYATHPLPCPQWPQLRSPSPAQPSQQQQQQQFFLSHFRQQGWPDPCPALSRNAASIPISLQTLQHLPAAPEPSQPWLCTSVPSSAMSIPNLALAMDLSF